MNSLSNLIQRCHKRNNKPIQQKKTVVSPAIYKSLFNHFTVFCAHKYPVKLHDLEEAEISLMPIGRAYQYDQLPHDFSGDRFKTRQYWRDWNMRLWHTSWGIRIYTGIPSQSGDAHWHDFEFSYKAICDTPNDVYTCIQKLCNAVVNPLLVITKSGGLRFSCRVPDYLHLNTKEKRLYVYNDTQKSESDYQRDVYLEVLGEKAHSAWDARYEIVTGDILNPPTISKEILFSTIDVFREKHHAPCELNEKVWFTDTHPWHVAAASFGSRNLDLAREALLKRKYTYIKQDGDVFHWRTQQEDFNVLLWEQDGNVWIRATKSNADIPTEDTRITDLWDDTGILPPIFGSVQTVNKKILDVREGKLSPLAIKRPSPVLEKTEQNERSYEPIEENINKIQRAFNNDSRVIALSGETAILNNYEIEKQILKTGAAAFSSTFSGIEEMASYFQKHDMPSLERWRNVSFNWDKIKHIPIKERMASPFQHKNVCEDADRFLALQQKGGNPITILCPQCPVYKECQDIGFLSQPTTLQSASTQLFGNERTFLQPNAESNFEVILHPNNGRERLCIIHNVAARMLFQGFNISIEQLENWSTDWKGDALGNFAQALHHTLEIKTEQDNLLVDRIRMVIQAFDQYEQQIITQLCHIPHTGRVVEQEYIDNQTGEVLAHYAVEFESGATAYIPLNNNAFEELKAAQLPVVQINDFTVNENFKIPLSIEQTIQFGFYDITTTEQIEKLPSVNNNPNWTVWHLLKRFITHYKRNADAPIVLYNGELTLWVPPIIHPNVKRLLLLSSVESKVDFNRTFIDHIIDYTRLPLSPWIEGNIVFQIRNGMHTIRTVLDYDNTYDVYGISKLGQRMILGLCAEIDRDLSVKHVIITYKDVVEHLKEVGERENVCLLTEFKGLRNLDVDIESANVIWIVGTPYTEPTVFWLQAQLLYGNDEEPLCYESDPYFQSYEDPRIQRIYIQNITGLLTRILGLVGLNRLSNKKVVLISSLHIPDITDRPQTMLFDWEDFEIAGSIDKLAETIKIREEYEREKENITAETNRKDIERILGCAPRTANSILQKLRGGNIPRITFREQILSHLADGEKKVSELIELIDGNPKSIHNEITRLTKNGELIKVRRGVYALPK